MALELLESHSEPHQGMVQEQEVLIHTFINALVGKEGL